MSKPVTLAITDHVAPDHQTEYEALVTKLHDLFQHHDGFLSVDTVRHRAEGQMEYTILLRFADDAASQSWRLDRGIQTLLQQIEAITGGTAQHLEVAGLGIWVDHVAVSRPAMPPYWKRVALSVLGVYPMLMLLLEVTAPVTAGLPQPLAVLTVVIILAGLLTWPIMPMLGRLLGPWLAAK